MKIPKSFQIFGHTISVAWQPTLLSDQSFVGQARHRTNEILLQPVVEGVKFPRTCIEQNYLHEVVHTILEKLQRQELSDDEVFVDTLAQALHQIMITSKGEL